MSILKGFVRGVMAVGSAFRFFATAEDEDYQRTLSFLSGGGDTGAGRKTVAGPDVNPTNAMALPAYWACIQAVSQDIAKMDLGLFKGNRTNKLRLDQHPIQQLIDAPNPEMTNMTMRETLQSWALGWGNGVAEIEWSYGGTPLGLWPIHPTRVNIERDRNSGEVVYRCYGGRDGTGGGSTVLSSSDVVHIRGMGNGVIGFSVARLAAESIGLSLAAETFGASLFGNGAHPHGFLKHPARLSKEAYIRLKESFEKQHAGAQNANKPILLEENIEWVPTSINPNEAQFLETRMFQIEEICRWFRMPPHKVQHLARSTFSNIESQAMEYVNDTLTTWAVRWEQELARKLLPQRAGMFFKHDFKTLLRGDHAARVAYYTGLRNIGVLNADEIRAEEDYNPIAEGEGGDKYVIQVSYTELKKVGMEPPTGAGPSVKVTPGKGTNANE